MSNFTKFQEGSENFTKVKVVEPKLKFVEEDEEPIVCDPVNHPDHYETGSFECIDVMEEVFGKYNLREYCLINAFKYLYRCKRKENTLQDVKKAAWYLNKYIDICEN